MKTEVKEREILFNAEMVRAVLDGSKTMTRRVVKLPPWATGDIEIDDECKPLACCNSTGCLAAIECPFGRVGDRLWVRERWAPARQGRLDDPIDATYACFPDGAQKWRLTGEYFPPVQSKSSWPEPWRWRPSIHMPRWASRITLEIITVKVERLQDISEADAQAEGVCWPGPYSGVGGKAHPTCVDAFRVLWNSVYGADAWNANPWVWALTFQKINETNKENHD